MVTTIPLPEFPAGLVEQLCARPALRLDRIAAATRRLAAGERPGADELAAAVVADTRPLRGDRTT